MLWITLISGCRLVMCPSFTVMERTPLIKVTLHYLYITSRFILQWNFAHVFAKKQCILCSTLRHKSYLTLLYVTSLLDSFRFGTFAHGFIMPLPRNLASSKGCSLAINSILIYSSLKLILVSRAERKVVTRVTYNQLILRYNIWTRPMSLFSWKLLGRKENIPLWFEF